MSAFPVLELRPDGDVAIAKVKTTSTKPTLKDIQTYLKKRTAPAVITTYPNGFKRVTILDIQRAKNQNVHNTNFLHRMNPLNSMEVFFSFPIPLNLHGIHLYLKLMHSPPVITRSFTKRHVQEI